MEENKLSEIKKIIYKAPIGKYIGLHGCEVFAKAVSEVRSLKDNEYLYRSGQESDAFYMVSSGRLALCKELPNMDRNSILHIIETGDLVGELSLIIEERHTISVQSIGDSVVYRFGNEQINALYEKEPSIMFDFLKAVIRRIHSTTASINRQNAELTMYLASGGKEKL